MTTLLFYRRNYFHSKMSFAFISNLILFVLIFATTSNAKENCIHMGGGNFVNGKVDQEVINRFKVLNHMGATMCRINLYPDHYLVENDWDQPNLDVLDEILPLAYENNIQPMILFEYYSSYHKSIGLGTYPQWYNIGKAYAKKYCQNGTWAKDHNIQNFGVSIFSAFNEPDHGESDFIEGGPLGPTPYAESLRGLADGVHSVDPNLQVIPGGFMQPNAHDDWGLHGLGKALAPLWNDGTLAGIDLHTYYDIDYAPMEKTYLNSAQANFDAVKDTCGITRDIQFYSTEFNYKKRDVTEAEAAVGLLTGVWDNLGVVGNDEHQRAAVFAFPWNLFHRPGKDPQYGMSESLNPYRPTLRGKVIQLVLQLTKDMKFTSLDPLHSGVFVLQNEKQKLWVWQNRKGWSTITGKHFTLRGIPQTANTLEVYGWDGLRQSLSLLGEMSFTVQNLEPEQTYMFLATHKDVIH